MLSKKPPLKQTGGLMKSLLLMIVLTSAFSAFAGDKYICKEMTENSWDSKRTMILTQLGNIQIKEGVKYDFKLEVFEGNSSKPIVSEKVTVETEDVMFGFSNKAKKIEGMIYMDELDQTWLKVGKSEWHFDCN